MMPMIGTVEPNLFMNCSLPQELERRGVGTSMPTSTTLCFEGRKSNQCQEGKTYFDGNEIQWNRGNREGKLPGRKEKKWEISIQIGLFHLPVPTPPPPWPPPSLNLAAVKKQLITLQMIDTTRVRAQEDHHIISADQCHKQIDQSHTIVQHKITTKIQFINNDHRCYHIFSSKANTSSVQESMDASYGNNSALASQALVDTPLDAPPRDSRVVGQVV